MKEKEILRSVILRLKVYELTGDVLWHSRLNSGKINTGRGYVQLCEAGTPDVMAIVRGVNKIIVVFIECKATGVKKLRYEQKEFFKSMAHHEYIFCVLINDPKQLPIAIKKAREL